MTILLEVMTLALNAVFVLIGYLLYRKVKKIDEKLIVLSWSHYLDDPDRHTSSACRNHRGESISAKSEGRAPSSRPEIIDAYLHKQQRKKVS